ncbi:MAG: hypothetical protein HBSIN02_22030 [Bacteroidia bacterium]|nr:MAG: hypothetical protein HBSIN02_22030 [Bacteroidia bacterium]
MKRLRILHIAPLNVAGVPFAMVDMQKKFGHEARLVTLHRNNYGFPEDLCLDLPLPRGIVARVWRNKKIRDSRKAGGGPPNLKPRNVAERIYWALDDTFRKSAIRRAVRDYELESFDVIHYDGGMDVFRDARLAKEWKRRGKKIVCHYMGSDLRLRGVHPDMDRISDLNLTNETDHLLLHPDIHYLFIPFDPSPYTMRGSENPILRIVHSPTNRAMKGTEHILAVMDRICKVRNVEFVLAEDLSHAEVLRVKATCDIAIEQVGNYGGTGYGRNSLETLAMGIPTVTDMTPECIQQIPDHPFILATPETLYQKLLELIDDCNLRRSHARKGRAWLERHHSYASVYRRLVSLYKDHGIV